MSAERLVFIDESGCKTGMRREYGWSKRGQRARGERPCHSWRTVSLIGAIRLGERPKLLTHRGAVNGRVFMKFLRRRLAPTLYPGDVVVLDNLSVHKSQGVHRALASVGASVAYLPTYSPELNPIELWWSDVKRQLRKAAISAQDELLRTVRRIRAAVPLAKIDGWFRHCLRDAQLN